MNISYINCRALGQTSSDNSLINFLRNTVILYSILNKLFHFEEGQNVIMKQLGGKWWYKLIKNIFYHKSLSFIIYWENITSGLTNSLWTLYYFWFGKDWHIISLKFYIFSNKGNSLQWYSLGIVPSIFGVIWFIYLINFVKWSHANFIKEAGT